VGVRRSLPATSLDIIDSEVCPRPSRCFAQRLPFRRLECGPGEEAQVDFGSGAPIVLPDGRRRRPHVLRDLGYNDRRAFADASAVILPVGKFKGVMTEWH
jgi:hypothetical protein